MDGLDARLGSEVDRGDRLRADAIVAPWRVMAESIVIRGRSWRRGQVEKRHTLREEGTGHEKNAHAREEGTQDK